MKSVSYKAFSRCKGHGKLGSGVVQKVKKYTQIIPVLQAVIVCVCQAFKYHLKALQYMAEKCFCRRLCSLTAELCSLDVVLPPMPAEIPQFLLVLKLQLMSKVNADSPQGWFETVIHVFFLPAGLLFNELTVVLGNLLLHSGV